MRTIGVLGASGFIGGRIVEKLHLISWAHVRPIVRRVSGMANLARFKLDIRIASGFDRNALTEAFRGCDTIIHAIGGDRRAILGSLTPTYYAAEEAGVRRIIYLSSASVHGQAPAPGTDEMSPLRTDHVVDYNNQRVRAERKFFSIRRRGNVELVVLRPGIVWGPRSQWTGGFANELLNGSAYVVNEARGICNSIYVDNLVHAVTLAVDAVRADGQVYLLGDDETVAWSELYRPIASAMGRSFDEVPSVSDHDLEYTMIDRIDQVRAGRIVQGALALLPNDLRHALGAGYAAWYESKSLSGPSRPGPASIPRPTIERVLLHRCQYKLPHTKAAQELGYAPIVSFAEGMRRTIGWLRFAGYPVSMGASSSQGIPLSCEDTLRNHRR